MTARQRGVRLGIDVGTVRVGVARSDPDGLLASPVATLARDLDADNGAVPTDISEVAALVRQHEVIQVVVGLPVTLGGRESHAASQVRAYAQCLAAAVAPVPVTLTDERMSTVVAGRRLSEQGVRGRRQRAVIDQVAAVEILQSWLDAQRRQT